MTAEPPPAHAAQDGAAAGAERHVARSTLVTSIAQVATLGLGAVLSLVILLRLGLNTRTDGLLAAYGVYSVVVLFAQSFRTAAVARLVEGERPFAAYDRFLGGVLVAWLAAGVVFVALGDVVASLLTGGLGPAAHDTARTALAVLWPAAGAQLVAALTAAQLGVRGEFALPGAAFALGGLTSIGLVLLLTDPLGHDAVAIGVASGALVTCAILLGRMTALGYRPRARELRPSRATLRAIGQMLGGATAHLAVQLTYLISLAFAARIGPGAVTLYSYAFFANSAIIGASSASIALVLAAPIASGWDRVPRSLDPHLRAVLRASLMVMLPVLGVVALIGTPAIDLVLGASLSREEAGTIVAVMLALSGTLLASTIEPVPMLAAFATSRYARVALLALAMAAIQVAAAAAALALDDVVVLGAAASLGALAYALMLLRLVYGPAIAAPIRIVLTELLALLLPAAALYVPLGIAAAALGGDGWALLAAAVASAAFVAFLRAFRPQHWALLLRVLPTPAPRQTA